MKPIKIKPLIRDGEEIAGVYHSGHEDGPLVISVGSEMLTLLQARRLASWLASAVVKVAAHNKNKSFDQDEGLEP